MSEGKGPGVIIVPIVVNDFFILQQSLNHSFLPFFPHCGHKESIEMNVKILKGIEDELENIFSFLLIEPLK